MNTFFHVAQPFVQVNLLKKENGIRNCLVTSSEIDRPRSCPFTVLLLKPVTTLGSPCLEVYD
jgi:hypothetical protein